MIPYDGQTVCIAESCRVIEHSSHDDAAHHEQPICQGYIALLMRIL